VLNARVDTFVLRLGTEQEQLTEGLRRARLYRDAGADSIYPITLADPQMIGDFVAACGVININLRPGGPLSLTEAASLGVRRISYGGSLFREATIALENAVNQLVNEDSGLHPA
jgi:2-methylisocitrate lyase-like PEP mutase family enzyme